MKKCITTEKNLQNWVNPFGRRIWNAIIVVMRIEALNELAPN